MHVIHGSWIPDETDRAVAIVPKGRFSRVRVMCRGGDRPYSWAKIVGLISAPATKIAQVVNAPAAKLARVVQAYASKTESAAA